MAKTPEIGISVKKDDDFSEWFTQLMQKAALADVRYNVKGFPVYRPWAVKSMRKMCRLMEQLLEATGHEPLLMPLLIPESNFHKEADHVEGFTPEVFWVTERGDGITFEERYALRPTSETALYDMYSKWIRSYKDLPLKLYQQVSVYRHDTKMTRPFLRTREIHWIEAHDVFATAEEALEQVKEDMETTRKMIYDILAMPHIFFRRPQWDKFPGAVDTYAADVLMPSGKVLQLPSTHFIGQEFAKVFGVKFTDKDEKEKHGWITCYGPAHSRNYGALIAFHGDDKGLKIPWDVAAQHAVIVPIIFDDSKEAVLKKCNELNKKLVDSGYESTVDDRNYLNAGWKFNQWEMKGVPIRIEVGPKDLEKGEIVLFRRDIDEKKAVKETDLLKEIETIKRTFTKNMRDKADVLIKDNIVDCSSLDEVKKALESGKMVRTCMRSIEKDGEVDAAMIEKEFSAEVRGEWAFKNEKVFCDCVISGKPAKHVVYIAKSY